MQQILHSSPTLTLTRLRPLAQQKPKQTAFFVRPGIHTLFVEIAPSWSAVRGAAEGVPPVPTSIPHSR